MTSIGECAFWGCTGLTSVTIPGSVTSISDCAFNGCTGLKTVFIGYGVTSIGEGAFWGCTSLTSVTIPDSVTSVSVTYVYEGYGESDWPFSGCDNLTDIYYAGTKSQWRNICGFVPYSVKVHYNSKVSPDHDYTDYDYTVNSLTVEVMSTSARVKASVTKNSSRADEDAIIIAVYKDNALVDMIFMEAEFAQGQTANFGGTLPVIEGAVYKAFVWDSLDNMQSLSNSVEK